MLPPRSSARTGRGGTAIRTGIKLALLGGLALAVAGQDPFTAAPDHYRLIFENAWARAARVTYGPHESAPVHDHPATRTALYIYLTDGGEFRFKHMTGFKTAGYVVTRKAVQAGAIRYALAAPETHSVEYMGDRPTEYVRIELRTESSDVQLRDVRIPPAAMDPAKSAVKQEFENDQIRILRVVCAAGEKCPASEDSQDPAIWAVISGADKGEVRWLPAGAASEEKGPIEAIRVELRTDPVAGRK